MPKPNVTDLAAFSAVAEHRSFRKAADALGIPRSSISHTILSLERNLGVRLLHRTTRSVAPTEAGTALLSQLRPLLRDFDHMLDTVAGKSGELVGTVRVNASEIAGRLLLATSVPTFLSRHPKVTFDLVTENRLIDIVEHGFDAGVRLADTVPQDMIAVPIGGNIRFLAVAAPSYLASYPPLTSPDDLRHHRCIRQRLPSGRPYRWEFEKQGHEIAIDVPGALLLDHSGLMAEAAAAGLGIAYVPELVASSLLNNGSLTAVLEGWSPPIPGLCLYYPGHRHVPSALRAFIDVLKLTSGAS